MYSHIFFKIAHDTDDLLLFGEWLIFLYVDEFIVHVHVDLTDLSKQETDQVTLIDPLLLKIQPVFNNFHGVLETSVIWTISTVHFEGIVKIYELELITFLVILNLDSISHAQVSVEYAKLLKL